MTTIKEFAERVAHVRSYTAQELGAAKFSFEADEVILVGSQWRDIIVKALNEYGEGGKE